MSIIINENNYDFLFSPLNEDKYDDSELAEEDEEDSMYDDLNRVLNEDDEEFQRTLHFDLDLSSRLKGPKKKNKKRKYLKF
ncbi:hypothetical protein [Ruminococcus albus]|uniref:Uncharacterized protein n=1 Tax=Ruminococcus albus SY3 TaxID=1341156 RepID=A0A011W274_RUMAL|nr:hypothetical protein [Ruminococcus albus]EXM40918.1 hypothetical protein RASY3_00925 [Ruminococcus albus SY3]